MKTLNKLFINPPPEFVLNDNPKKDKTAFFCRFCKEQPQILTFFDSHCDDLDQYDEWVMLADQLAHQIWWNYLGNGMSIKSIPLHELERRYAFNKDFVDNVLMPACNEGMESIEALFQTRSQPALRMLMFESVIDATQTNRLDTSCPGFAEKLLHNQKYLHAVLGAVIDAMDEAAADFESAPSLNVL